MRFCNKDFSLFIIIIIIIIIIISTETFLILGADRRNEWFCSAHVFTMNWLYYIFQLIPMLLVYEFHVYVHMVRNYNYPTAVFFSFLYRFLRDFIKVDNDDDDDYYHYHYYENPLKTAITYYYGSTNVRMLRVKIKSLG